MHPDLMLNIVAALAGFLLKTALGFGLCWLLSLLASSPESRFMAWLGFLGGAGAYWLWLAAGLTREKPSLSGAYPAAVGAAASGIAAGIDFRQVPAAWAGGLGIALRVLGLLYSIALGYFLVVHVRRRLHLRWVLRFACEPPAEMAEFFASVVGCDGGSARPRLLVLSGIPSPATFGWLRPTILLPALCLEQDRCELEDIVRHELHHIRRRDFAVNAGAGLCRALLCFHPAAWFAMRRMRLERELACDRAVIAGTPERRARYAESLVRFARLHSGSEKAAWDLDFAASSPHLHTRVHSVLREPIRPPAWKLGLRAGCGLLLLSGFFAAAPSLAVAFSYARRQVSPPLTSSLTTPFVLTPRSRPARAVRRSTAYSPRPAQPPAPETAPAAAAPAQTYLPEAVQLVAPAPSAANGVASGAASGPSPAPPASGAPPTASSGRHHASMMSIVAATVTDLARIAGRDRDRN